MPALLITMLTCHTRAALVRSAEKTADHILARRVTRCMAPECYCQYRAAQLLPCGLLQDFLECSEASKACAQEEEHAESELGLRPHCYSLRS